ncbi:hypothetical protein D3Y57_09580 [Sphingomonas paeninsulae]|uniref:Uncharacterized protein n=1 Tax=Sphingomonas paeninsulae TaxID=2319844 RepID=A0A494TL76_SPHPE|nr:hypothetical protein [Sphingomonas paeninsulae]AYJ86168.1 hypothetical protein D3Y57_09580 [Sphingomonas paeninsulae]
MNSNEVLARAEAVLQRHGTAPRMEQRVRAAQRRSAARKAMRIVWAAMAILLTVIIAGFILPTGVGTTGVMIAGLIFLLVALGVIMMPGERQPDAAALPTTALAQLPLRTENWLASQRALLPAPAQRLSDGIGLKLEALAPQLQTLDEREPAAAEIRRLIADELPELVKGYGRVPVALRREGVDGMAPDKQLIDGLTVVDSELARMSEQLARGDLEKLATQGKYLELKYQGDVLG